MSRGLRSVWSRCWPAITVVVGVGLLSPHPVAGESRRWIDAGVVTAAGMMARPLQLWSDADWAEASAAAPGADPFVLARLEQAGRPVIPDSSWAAGGRFEALHVAGLREGKLRLLADSVPVRQPVLLADTRLGDGEVCLIGFTVEEPGGSAAVRLLSAKGLAIGAVAGEVDRRVRFRASGHGEAMLHVDGPDTRTHLRVGDPVYADPSWASPSWGTTWTPPAGARLRLGTVGLDESEPDWTRRHRVLLDHDPDELEQVAVLYPDEIPGPHPPALQPVTATVLVTPAGRGRDVFLIAVGVESGIEAGQAVVDGHRLLGRVVSVGWRTSRVRGVRDPGGRWTALVFDAEGVRSTQLATSITGGFGLERGGEARRRTVASGFADPWIPIGLWLDSEADETIPALPRQVAVLTPMEVSR